MKNDDSIRVGDMVMVVRGVPCCGNGCHFGKTFVVHSIERIQTPDYVCSHCGCYSKSSMTLVYPAAVGLGFLLSRLRRVTPPNSEESMETLDEVTA